VKRQGMQGQAHYFNLCMAYGPLVEPQHACKPRT